MLQDTMMPKLAHDSVNPTNMGGSYVRNLQCDLSEH